MNEKQVTKLNVLVDMLENYNNIKNDGYSEKIIKEIKETLNN